MLINPNLGLGMGASFYPLHLLVFLNNSEMVKAETLAFFQLSVTFHERHSCQISSLQILGKNQMGVYKYNKGSQNEPPKSPPNLRFKFWLQSKYYMEKLRI